MSYSFNARGANKSALMDAVKEEMRMVVSQQPSHKQDRDVVLGAAESLADLLMPDASKDMFTQMNGSLSTNGEGHVTYASVSITVDLVEKLPPKAA